MFYYRLLLAIRQYRFCTCYSRLERSRGSEYAQTKIKFISRYPARLLIFCQWPNTINIINTNKQTVEEKHGRWFHSRITRWGCCVLDTVCRMRSGVYGGVRVATAADGPQTKTMMRFNGPRATLPAVDQRPGDQRNTPVP